MKVTIFTHVHQGDDWKRQPIGEFYLDDEGQVAVKPLTENQIDREFLLTVAGWKVPYNRDTAELYHQHDFPMDAESHPELWLKTLPSHFARSTTCSAKMEEGNATDPRTV
jgi:hypothetical protein